MFLPYPHNTMQTFHSAANTGGVISVTSRKERH